MSETPFIDCSGHSIQAAFYFGQQQLMIAILPFVPAVGQIYSSLVPSERLQHYRVTEVIIDLSNWHNNATIDVTVETEPIADDEPIG